MKLIILSPNLHLIFSEEQKKSLEQKYDVEYFTTPDVIQNISILQSDKEKIIAIDPDFCGWKVTRADIDSMKQVKAICLQTTSFHYIDTPYCKSLGIPVLNLKGFSANAVAETVMMMMFALARKLPMVLREGCKVDFERYRGVELSGRKIGII